MAEIARVRTILTGFSGAPGVSTQYFSKSGAISWSAAVEGIVDNVQAAWAELTNIASSAMTIATQGEVDVIEDTTGEIQETLNTDTVSQLGVASTGEYLPIASGLCVTLRTGGVVAGKHVRGRVFLVPCCTLARSDDGTPTAGALADCASFAGTLQDGGFTGHTLLVWSRPKKSLVEPGEFIRFGSSHAVTGDTVSDQFAILRSRRD